jgi:hypothetical protein
MDIRGKKESSEKSYIFKLKLISVVLSASFFVYLSWYSYKTQVMTIDPKDLPIIEFNKKIKFKPGDPGGVEIANLDKGIYDYISGRSNNKKITVSSSKEEAISRHEMLKTLSKKGEDTISNKTYQRTKVQPEISYEIRIAKIKSLSSKGKACEIMGDKYKRILSSMKCKVSSTQKLGKREYYLHYGPISSKRGARSVCVEIVKLGGACKPISAR